LQKIKTKKAVAHAARAPLLFGFWFLLRAQIPHKEQNINVNQSVFSVSNNFHYICDRYFG